MNEIWDLEPIYRGFDGGAFEEELALLCRNTEELEVLSQALSTMEPEAGLCRGVALLEQISDLSNKLAGYALLRQAADTRDPEAGSQLGRVMAAVSAAAGPEARFRSWASGLPELSDLVAGSEKLKDYGFLFENMRENSRYLLSGRGEEIMARMELSGSSAWGELQQYLTSTVTARFRGEDMPLSAVRNLAYDPDPRVRREAYEAELACYEKICDPVAYALNSIKLETLTDCSLRGYADPLERTLKQADMKKETLDAMLETMGEYMPKFRQYLKAKGKALGHENGLPWYDLFAPMGASAADFTPESAGAYLVSLFSEFDPEMGALVAQAFRDSWIDFYPRDGKSGGAFCEGVPAIGESRILTNFTGVLGDVVTLAHELGHAFHNSCIFPHRPLNRNYSMPLAETASTFNECVVMESALRSAKNDQERLSLLESQLQDTTQIICDIYSRFLFEKAVFENRQTRFMDAKTLCDMMLSAQEQSYGDGLDQTVRHPYMWVCKSHYYGPTYYNFPYAFGGLFARGLYACYEKEGAAFLPKYKQLLRTTTVATAEDTAAVAGIDLTDKAFWSSALQTVADQIDRFCALVQGE